MIIGLKIMEGDIFHILNRGVEGRKIFLNKKDYVRFTDNLYDFNNKNEALFPHNYRRLLAMRKPIEDKLVDVLCWTLMPNHYHILVQERVDGGAGQFSKKISSGYTQYFNLRNKRSGVLFQGRSKIIPANEEDHFLYLPYYIFANPIKLIEPKWKECGIQNHKRVIKFLKDYKWSSLNNFFGEKHFAKIVNKKELFELYDFKNDKQLQDDFASWLCDSQ